jgi:hypothetical protein
MKSEDLDREVAERILGIRCVSQKMQHKNTDGKIPTGYRLQWPDGQRVSAHTCFYGWGWNKTRAEAWGDCPRFSTHIETAWIVWKTLAENYQYFRLFVGALSKQDSGNDLVNSLMKLTPENICRTALAVMNKAKKARTG